MVKFMDIMTRWLKITCADTSPLISEMMDHKPPFSKRWRLKMHLAICQVCRFYLKQFEVLRALAKKLGQEDPGIKQKIHLPEECKERMKDALRNSP